MLITTDFACKCSIRVLELNKNKEENNIRFDYTFNYKPFLSHFNQAKDYLNFKTSLSSVIDYLCAFLPGCLKLETNRKVSYLLIIIALSELIFNNRILIWRERE